MHDDPSWALPTVDEILRGETQAGVPRPTVSIDDLRQQTVARPSLWARLIEWLSDLAGGPGA